jgi:hypothetical protein
MFTRILKLLMSTLVLGLVAGEVWATSADSDSAIVHRDTTYEQNLRWNASEDQAITPARVIRYMMGMRGAQVFNSRSNADFVPIVNVNQSRVRVIAAINYKF